MPMFKYEVVDRDGQVLAGVMNAAAESDVRSKLTARGYGVRSVQADSTIAPSIARPQKTPFSGATLPDTEMGLLYRSLQQYLKSGMTIHEAMMEVSVRSPNRAMRAIAGRIAERARGGEQLSVCMKDYPGAFPPHAIGEIAAAELGGFMPDALGDLAAAYEERRKASVWWLVWLNKVLWINAIGSTLLAPFVSKIFSKGVTDIRGGILAYLKWTYWHMALPIAAAMIVYYLCVWFFTAPQRRLMAQKWMMKLPAYWRQASKDRSLHSFTRALWRLQQRGALPIQAWEAASRTAENLPIAKALEAQTEAIRTGSTLSDAATASGAFPEVDIREMVLAERTGHLPETLGRMVAYYDDASRVSTRRARWSFIHISIWANIIMFALLIYFSVATVPAMMDWAQSFVQEGS